MSPFLPWSEKSKGWEFHAEDLRDLVPRPAEAGSLPFDPWELAPCVGLRVVECRFGGLDAAERAYLSGGASSHWSGGVLPVLLPDGSRVCMLNPDHSYRRKKITLMEETHRRSDLQRHDESLRARMEPVYRSFVSW